MSSNGRKRTLAVRDSHVRPPRRSSKSRDEAIDRLTTVLANFVSSTVTQEKSSSVKGEVVPSFDPENEGQSIFSWCSKVDELRDIYKWSEEATISFAITKLVGLAETWYQSLPTVKFTWNEWKQKLQEAFPSHSSYFANLQEMINREKSPDETYTRYYYEKLALLNKCKIYGPDAVSCIIGGLSSVVVKTGATAGNHQTTDSLYAYLSNLNNLPGMSKTSGTAKSPIKHNRHRFVPTKPSKKGGKPIICYRCNKPGHTANLCGVKPSTSQAVNEREDNRCMFCRRVGHVEENCFAKKRALNAKPTI